jgi:hypothetical protein
MSQEGKLKLGAIHPITGRQWELGKNEAWPDLEIVLPFSCRVIDTTGTVIGPAISSPKVGGYEVIHNLNKIEVYDLINDLAVPNVKGVWAATPGGDSARLHLLSQDPYSWLTPHVDTIVTAFETPPRVIEQNFGLGEVETFMNEKRFGEVLVKPSKSADLVRVLQSDLLTRILNCDDFTLSFRTASGAQINVDRLSLVLVVRKASEGEKSFFTTSKGNAVTSSIIKLVCGDLYLYLCSLTLSQSVSTIRIRTTMKNNLLVYAVRYREARKYITKWAEKTLLVPGKYRISVEGTSQAVSYAGLPASKTVSWHLKQDFGVKYPETIRPYINYSTIGDSRIFSTIPVPLPPDPLAWNPTMPGIGFPAYRKYYPIVRFLVRYMDVIFSKIKMAITYEKHSVEVVDDLQPKNNPDGTSSLPAKSQDWILLAGGSIKPDQELILSQDLPQEGMAQVVLSFKSPDEKWIKLDEWSCYISRFECFSQHLYWPGSCLKTYYDSSGKYTVPSCQSLFRVMVHLVSAEGNRINLLPHEYSSRTIIERQIGEMISLNKIEAEKPEPYPDELASVPLDWRLAASLTENLKPLDQVTGIRFARFARNSGARFNEGVGDKVNGIQDTVDETTIEAVLDTQGRPVALWLRTPEPVDWRRVKANLTIKHVIQTGPCPSGYAHRKPLDLTITVLPSTDASSAFLIGSFIDVHTCLPRGEYELSLSFDPYLEGLEKLRPYSSVGPVPEQAKFKFIQPFGLDWPLPITKVVIPAGILEYLVEAYLQNPEPPGPIPNLLKKYEQYLRSGISIAEMFEAKIEEKTGVFSSVKAEKFHSLENVPSKFVDVKTPSGESAVLTTSAKEHKTSKIAKEAKNLEKEEAKKTKIKKKKSRGGS